MSIIQQIREKYAAVGIGFIALSLIGFILMDSAKNNSGGGIDPQDAVGEVSGRSISYNEFITKAKGIENMQQMNGRNVDEELRQQINSEVWRQLVERTLLENEYAKLGLVVSDKEFNDLLFGANPPQWLAQQFTDPNTGQFDVMGAKQAINEMKKNRAGGNTAMLEEFYLDPLIDQTLRSKYYALQRGSAYVPKFLVEKTIAENAQSANIRFVQVPFTDIPDSTVVITDAMISKYVAARPKEFKQEENLRSIAYVGFSFNPSSSDSATALTALNELRDGFVTTDNPGDYVSRSGSSMAFADEYFSKERIQIPQKDSIIGAGLGKVYGPYIDGNSYVLSRVVDVKTRPDSVKARHILVSTYDMQTQQPTLPDSVAKAKIDSIQAVIKGGASFASLATALSDDKGSAEKGGDLGYFASGMMVKEFNDFCFDKPTGSSGVVKTQFGYHLIEVTDQKNFVPAYKIAYLSKPVEASIETVNDAMNAANVFAGNSRTLKAFDENVAKQGLNKLVAPDIRENEYNITGLGVNRSLVKEIFEAKVGDVLEPVELNGQYIVVAVTGAEKSGLMTPAKARPMVEFIIRNEEKGKKIIEGLGTITTLDALAAAKKSVVRRADSVLFASPMINGVGFEPKVAGYAFSKTTLNKVGKPVTGSSGVFVIETLGVMAGQNTSSAEEVKNTLLNAARNVGASSSMQALRDKGSVEDKRSKFF
jgi:peptidyl-prolyl cis-trans isomerase D